MARNTSNKVSFMQAFEEANVADAEGRAVKSGEGAKENRTQRTRKPQQDHVAPATCSKPSVSKAAQKSHDTRSTGWVVEGKEERGGFINKGIYIFDDQDKPLRDQAYAETRACGRSVSTSDIIRRAIDEYLERHAD